MIEWNFIIDYLIYFKYLLFELKKLGIISADSFNLYRALFIVIKYVLIIVQILHVGVFYCCFRQAYFPKA